MAVNYSIDRGLKHCVEFRRRTSTECFGELSAFFRFTILGKRRVILKSIEATEMRAVQAFRMSQPSGNHERKTYVEAEGDLSRNLIDILAARTRASRRLEPNVLTIND